MKLEYPGGISIDKISPQGDENAFAFPHPKVSGAQYDYSFSGLKTCVINTIHNAEQKMRKSIFLIWRHRSKKRLSIAF